MTKQAQQQMLKDSIKQALISITPWKNNISDNEDYKNGWNDCVKQIKKNRIRLLKHLEEHLEDSNKDG